MDELYPLKEITMWVCSLGDAKDVSNRSEDVLVELALLKRQLNNEQ